jgi:hypothetical protein
MFPTSRESLDFSVEAFVNSMDLKIRIVVRASTPLRKVDLCFYDKSYSTKGQPQMV